MVMVTPSKPYRSITYNVSCEVENQQYALYTCPPNASAQMNLLYIANANGVTDIAVTWYRTRYNQTFQIIEGKNFAAGAIYQWDGSAYIVFEPGDTLYITPSGNATPNIDALCTVVETFIPVG